MVGLLIVDVLVVDVIMRDSLGALGASLGVSLMEPLVADSLEGPFMGRSKIFISYKPRSFH
jgi:hypothetical protein